MCWSEYINTNDYIECQLSQFIFTNIAETDCVRCAYLLWVKALYPFIDFNFFFKMAFPETFPVFVVATH